jgi:hypothetical protein
MDALKRSDFFEHFHGRVFLSQFEATRLLSAESEAGPITTTGLSAAPDRAMGAKVLHRQSTTAEVSAFANPSRKLGNDGFSSP